jgi:hypothetical protein
MIPNTNHDLVAIHTSDDDDGTRHVWPTPIVGWEYDEDKCLQPILVSQIGDDKPNLIFDRGTGRLYQSFNYCGVLAVDEFANIADQFKALLK